MEHGLNEWHTGSRGELGLIVQGGLFNTLVRALQQFGLADAFGELALPTLVLNVTSPLVPDQITDFCAGKRAVLVLEIGHERTHFETAFPRLNPVWLDTSAGGDQVLLLTCEALAP